MTVADTTGVYLYDFVEVAVVTEDEEEEWTMVAMIIIRAPENVTLSSTMEVRRTWGRNGYGSGNRPS
jgi:hypothetical protein